MILYSTKSSPNSVPVRIAAWFKGLDIATAEPPGGLGSTNFHAINPVGTVPCLVLDDGFVLPESVAIMDYLDDVFPHPQLMPEDPRARAAVRVLQRIAELGILNQAIELRRLLVAARRGDELFSMRLSRLVRGLASADLYLSDGTRFASRRVTMADCHLAPALSLLRVLQREAGIPDLLATRPRLANYLGDAENHEAIGEMLSGMDA